MAVARAWARELPTAFARNLADALRAGPDALRVLQQAPALPSSAHVLTDAFALAEAGEGPYASGALTALLDAIADEPVITTVWTGPVSGRPGGRLTLAVLADLIGEARDEILLVSYATFPGHEIRAALADACARGVTITTLCERATDNPHFTGSDDPFPGLPALRLAWPGHDRPPGAALHAKILVIDRRTALVGSANLTDYGLERNVECGLLVRGGTVPVAIAEHVLATPAFVPIAS